MILGLAAMLLCFGCSAGNDAGTGGALVPSAISRVVNVAASSQPIELGAITRPEPYAYQQLSAPDRERYRILLDVFQTREERSYPDNDMESLARVRDCVLADHPELFGVESVHMETTSNMLTGEIAGVSIAGTYSQTPDEVSAVLALAERAAGECFEGLPASADDYAKAKRAYEYLVNHVEYDQEGNRAASSSEQTIEGALVNGMAVCGGYANAFTYLLQSVGVQCVVVSGIANGTEHAWCLAQLDGDYYYVDPTWGDPVGGSLNYDYLAITTADSEREHAATSTFALPLCAASADNYYTREGLLFTWADEERLTELIAGGCEQVRCVDRQTYEALHDFVTSGRLANRLDTYQYRYSFSNELFTLKVYLD